MKYLGLDTVVITKKGGCISIIPVQVYDVDVSDFEDVEPTPQEIEEFPPQLTKPFDMVQYEPIIKSCTFEEPSAVSRVTTVPIDPIVAIALLSK